MTYQYAYASYPSSAFKQIDLEIYNDPTPKEVVYIDERKRPRSYSQDAFGNCYAVSTAYVLDATNCRTQGDKDCRKLGDQFSFSRFDIARFGNSLASRPEYRDFYPGISEGGSPKAILHNIVKMRGNVASQKCSAIEKILTNFSDKESMQKAQARKWLKLKNAYETFQDQKKKCESCALNFASTAMEDISKDFNIQKDNAEVLKLFGEKTYDIFLDKLFVPEECSGPKNSVRLEDADKLEIGAFPPDTLKNSNFDDSINAIKNALSKSYPVLVSNVCLGENFNIEATQKQALALKKQAIEGRSASMRSGEKNQGFCPDAHSVVISGYRKICKKHATPEDCRHSLKIENSWGEEWQKSNNDGWVDAQIFMDRTAYLGQNLLWIEDKQ